MMIRNRLTLLFTTVVAAIMLLFAFAVYFFYAHDRQDEFRKLLHQQALMKASLLFDAGVDPTVLQLIYKNSRNVLHQEEVAIYDTAFVLRYHDAVDIDFVKETRPMIDAVKRQKSIAFIQDDWQVVGFLYRHSGQDYVITAAAHDDYGLHTLANLRDILIVLFLSSIIVTLLVSRFLAHQSLKPISSVVSGVEEITATNLDSRLDEGNSKDEIAVLSITFNRMLDRLEHSFEAQKQFVVNISHELRTPLAAIIAELDLARLRSRSADDYREAIDRARNDAGRLARLTSLLLDLAKASYDRTEIAMHDVRIDEVLIDASGSIHRNDPEADVNAVYDGEIEDDREITVRGNHYLLSTAFSNIMENGCKYSADRSVDVHISAVDGTVTVRFVDNGVGIPPDDVPHIFTPFFRGSNTKPAHGSGIGLSLTHRIIALHGGSITFESRLNEGTTFIVTLPNIGADRR